MLSIFSRIPKSSSGSARNEASERALEQRFSGILNKKMLSRRVIVDILKNTDEKNSGRCVSVTGPGDREADTERADTVALPLFPETKVTSFHLRDFLWRYGTKYGSIIKRIPIVRTIAEMLFQDRTLAKVRCRGVRDRV
jgi:hypothetical protein